MKLIVGLLSLFFTYELYVKSLYEYILYYQMNNLYTPTYSIPPTAIVLQQSNEGYIALKQETLNIDSVNNIQQRPSVTGQITHIVNSPSVIEDRPLPKKNPNTILKDDVLTKFYVGSLYVLGLYVFYRILVKNNK
jgi:hypothetical protein